MPFFQPSSDLLFQAPWWLRNGHVQTVVAALWPHPTIPHNATVHRVDLIDGDQLAVHDDRPLNWLPGDPATLLIHGLGGCHRSPSLVRIADKLMQRGVRVFRLDLRTCGAGASWARLPYHGGQSSDLAAVVQSIQGWCQEHDEHRPAAPRELQLHRGPSPIAIVGVSLGGNILLKYLGELADAVPDAVAGAIAMNSPIDLAACVEGLRTWAGRRYDRYFTSLLIQHVERHQAARPDAPRLASSRTPRCLNEFDEAYTAPIGGFHDAAHYYAQASSLQYIDRIRTPTWLIAAENDPMVPIEIFGSSLISNNPNVRFTRVPGGGHCAYLAPGIPTKDGDPHWMEWRIVQAVLRVTEPAASFSMHRAPAEMIDATPPANTAPLACQAG